MSEENNESPRMNEGDLPEENDMEGNDYGAEMNPDDSQLPEGNSPTYIL